MRNVHHPKFAICLMGKSGHGKSTKFAEILSHQKADYWFIYDHKQEFASQLGLQPCTDMAGIERCANTTGKVCFDPSKMFAGKKPEGFLFFCDFVFEVSEHLPGRKLFICDELQWMCLQSRPEELVAIVDDGRQLGIDCFFIAQCANQLHNMVLNQFTEILTFKQQTKNATEPLENLGFNSDEVIALKPGQWIWRNTTSGEEIRGGEPFEIKSTTKKYLRGTGKRALPKRDSR